MATSRRAPANCDLEKYNTLLGGFVRPVVTPACAASRTTGQGLCRSIALLTLLAARSGCVTARPLTLPSGAQGEVILCNGMARSIADCYEKAGEACPSGYDVVDASGEAHPLIMATSSSLVGGSVVHRPLMVQCH